MSNARLRLNHRDPWAAAYIEKSDQLLREEIGKALAAARIKLGIVL